MKLCKYCNGTGRMPDHAATGSALRTQRDEAGITLRQMADLIGVSHSFLSQLENGRRSWRRSLAKRYEQAIKQAERKMHKQYVGPSTH